MISCEICLADTQIGSLFWGVILLSLLDVGVSDIMKSKKFLGSHLDVKVSIPKNILDRLATIKLVEIHSL